jgi:hypothetical protein
LSWTYEEKQGGDPTLVFRASVSFLMDGHEKMYCGSWCSSKKKAQRDTAEKVLWFLRTEGAPEALVLATPGATTARCLGSIDGPIAELHCFVREQSGLSSNEKVLSWSFESRTDADRFSRGVPYFRATVAFILRSVPQSICGGWHTSKKKAQRDTAERVLIYLRSEKYVEAGLPLAPLAALGKSVAVFRDVVDQCTLGFAPFVWPTLDPLSFSLSDQLPRPTPLSWTAPDDVFAVLASRLGRDGSGDLGRSFGFSV